MHCYKNIMKQGDYTIFVSLSQFFNTVESIIMIVLDRVYKTLRKNMG